MALIIAYVLSQPVVEVLGLGAVLITSVGVWLKWQQTTHLSEIEEAIKKGQLLPEEARQRARYVDLRATLLVGFGMLLLLFAAFGWSA